MAQTMMNGEWIDRLNKILQRVESTRRNQRERMEREARKNRELYSYIIGDSGANVGNEKGGSV